MNVSSDTMCGMGLIVEAGFRPAPLRLVAGVVIGVDRFKANAVIVVVLRVRRLDILDV